MSPVFKWAAPLVAALLLSTPVAAQTEADRHFVADVDNFIRHALAEVEAVPGLSIAVVEGAEPLHVAGYGIADVETGAPVDADTAFYIASSTKSFTALAVATLAAEEGLDLDAPAARWAPQGLLPDVAAPVSLTDLLSHRSGLDNAPISFRAAMSGEHSPEIMRGLLARTEPHEERPHGVFRYSNAGYNMTTTLLEQRFSRDWRELVRDEVLEPIGMTATTPRVSDAVRAGRRIAAAHIGLLEGAPVRSPVQKVDATMQSAGGLLSTARDMARWLEVQLNDGVIDGRRVFPAGLVADTHVQRVGIGSAYGPYTQRGYGLGWFVGDYGEEPVVYHFGNFAGSRTHVSFMPERRLGVVVMVNEDLAAGDIADLIANYVYDRRAGLPDLQRVYAARLADLVTARDQRRARIAADRQARADRQWTLSRPAAEYAGTYESPEFGAVRVAEADGVLVVEMGVLRARAEPFTQPDSIRVELTPYRGEAMVFVLDDTGRPGELQYQGRRFFRR